MKGIIVLLLVMVVFIAGTAWIAQQWRLDATKYVTERQRDGDILRQKLESEGIQRRSEIEADFEKQGATESAQIEAETERIGRTLVASAETDRTTAESVQGITTAEYVLVPLQGTLMAQVEFLKKANDQNLPADERRIYSTIYDLFQEARMSVNKEYDLMLDAIGKAMTSPPCPGDRPR